MAEPRRGPFARALTYWPVVRGDFLKGLLCILPASGLSFATLLIYRHAVDGMVDGSLGVRDIGLWMAFALALEFVKGAAKYGMRWWVTGASRRFEAAFRLDLFRHLTTLTPHDLARVRTGDVMSRSVADIEAVRMLLGPAVMYNAQALVVVPLAIGLMWWIDPVLAAALVLPFLGLALVVKFAARPTQRYSEITQRCLGDMSTAAQENVSGIRIVKAFAREAVSENVFRRLARAFLDANVRLATIRGTTSASIHVIKDLGVLAIVAVGGWHLVEGRLTAGDFLLFLNLLDLALWPLIAVGWMLGMYHRARAGAERLDELFELRPSVTEAPGARAPADGRGELEVRELSHAFDGRPALERVSLRVPAGRTLGITGRTGSGKSTLVQLVSRQVDPPPGTVLIDGRDIREVPISWLRARLGVVPQDTFLFSESIRDNIAFAGEHVADETIREMARAAHVEEDIEGFPSGYDELLGERGVTLSGGQRQRTAIARTLAADPPIMILDDCLSAVDSATEQAILRGLRARLAGRTAIIVSHRVAALSLADEIIVLDEGRVLERGTHAELVRRGGLYAQLHERQRLQAEIEAL